MSFFSSYQPTRWERFKAWIWPFILFALMLLSVALFGATALYLVWPLGPAAVTRPLDFAAAFGWAGVLVTGVAVVRLTWAAKVVEE